MLEQLNPAVCLYNMLLRVVKLARPRNRIPIGGLAASDSIHRVQETHVAIYHILWDLVHTLLADDRGALAQGSTP